MDKKNNKKHEEIKYPIECYTNRELSWLKFNERVLEEAFDKENPLCEQLNFLSIFQSNLDEFFMVRVGTLYDERKSNDRDNKTRMTAREQLDAILDKVGKMLKEKDKCYHTLAKKLKQSKVEITKYDKLTNKEKHEAKRYFNLQVLPLLSPQIVSHRQPFPFLASKELYCVALLENKRKGNGKGPLLGIIPSSGAMLKRLVPISSSNSKYILIEDLIKENIPSIFKQYNVKSSSVIRLVRNADISIDDDHQDDIDIKRKDYRKVVEKMITTRKRMGAIKLEYAGKNKASLISVLCEYLELPKKHAFYSTSPLDFDFLSTISNMLSSKKELFYPTRVPQLSPEISEDKSMISQIKKKDLFLSYPYDSMRPFLRLLTEAANDPDVVSIRITLYRLAKISQVVSVLSQAAENGKDVMALVELRARFDEANNVEQSRELEDSGCRIIYGLEKFKVHSKLCLITRKSSKGVEYITQVGTGNYNEKTARLYTDYCLMTANQAIGKEAANVFNALAVGETVKTSKHLLAAPNCLQNKVIEKIDKQISLAKQHKKAYIGFKLNSLTDKKVIDKLIEASMAGVKIQMLIRGICCLVPGIPSYTDNIEVSSIVGRYLEHGRIYIFGADKNEEVYIASADMMTRNTVRRVEIAAPIYDPEIRDRILQIFKTMFKDTCKRRIEQSDGTYIKAEQAKDYLNSQEYFMERSYLKAKTPLPEKVSVKQKKTNNTKKKQPKKNGGKKNGRKI